MNIRGYIPVMVEGRKEEKWYLDVSNLSLGELLELRKELLGTSENTIRVLDGLLKNEHNICVNNAHYYDNTIGYNRTLKHTKKKAKMKLKKNSKEKRGMIKNDKY